MKTRSLQIVLAVLLSGFIGYYVGVNKVTFDWKNYQPKLTVVNKEPPAQYANIDMKMFWDVMQRLQTSYYDKKVIDSQKLVNGAISGMVQSLGDPYTVYLPPVQNNNFKESLSTQEFSCIGSQL